MRRGRHEFRLTVWTFVAPVALVVAVLVVINIAGEVVDDGLVGHGDARGHAHDGPPRRRPNAGSEPGTTTGGPRGAASTSSSPATRSRPSRRSSTPPRTQLQELNPNVDALALVPGQRIRVS